MSARERLARVLGDPVRRALDRPVRRVLDRQVRWTMHAIDARLGMEDHPRSTVHERLDDLDRMGRDVLAGVGWRDVPEPGADLAALDAARAGYLNWAAGPDGYAAQNGLWFNPPVPVEHHAGRVDVLLVNERIVEHPFVFGALADLEPGARILDVGGSESTVALSLASLGHDVTVVDPRPHRLAHPRLHHAACRLDELPPADPPYDAAIALSAIEHFGLEHYGVEPAGERMDLAAAAHLRELVAPGGRLVLTVPFGDTGSVDGFQRVYDEAALADLLDGWEVETSRRVGRTDRVTWEPDTPSRGGHGVALVSARRPA